MKTNLNDKKEIATKILAWYDQNARSLPWRISPAKIKEGFKPDPYEVWLSEIMLQQTTVKTVIPYFQNFITLWPTLFDLSKAQDYEILEAWAGLGYYRRASNLIKCASLLCKKFHCNFPTEEAELRKLPGVGNYTAAAISAIAFNNRSVVIDGNVERVISRLFAIQTPIRKSKNTIKNFAEELTPSHRVGDYSQSIMDLGALICKPKNPKCSLCPIKSFCSAYKKDLVSVIPRKEKKKLRPLRLGFAFLALTNSNEFLTLRRPAQGLLGGMIALPCSEWLEKKLPTFSPPFEAKWEPVEMSVKHSFTHFDIQLKIVKGYISKVPKIYEQQPIATIDLEKFPTLFKKVLIKGLEKELYFKSSQT